MKLSCLCGCIVNHIVFAVSLFVYDERCVWLLVGDILAIMVIDLARCRCARLVDFLTLLLPYETDFIRPDYLPRKQ